MGFLYHSHYTHLERYVLVSENSFDFRSTASPLFLSNVKHELSVGNGDNFITNGVDTHLSVPTNDAVIHFDSKLIIHLTMMAEISLSRLSRLNNVKLVTSPLFTNCRSQSIKFY